MSPAALAAALALMAAGGSDQADIDQIGAPAPGAAAHAVGVQQLSEPGPLLEPSPPAPHGPEQLAGQQLNTERPSAAAVPDAPEPPAFQRPNQLNDQQATAEPPAGPYVPFPQQTTVQAVFGQDACDPAADGAEDEVCANRIETRAAEYAPKPSPEAQLLAESRPAGEDAKASARRLAEGDVQDSDAAQAYVFTSGLGDQGQPAQPKLSPETQKALDAAAALLGTLPAGAVVTTR